jgi:hypothetical protein
MPSDLFAASRQSRSPLSLLKRKIKGTYVSVGPFQVLRGSKLELGIIQEDRYAANPSVLLETLRYGMASGESLSSQNGSYIFTGDRRSRPAKDDKKSDDLYGEWQADRASEAYEVERLRTIDLCRKAARYHVLEPDYNDPRFWDSYPRSQACHLTIAGIDFIESRINQKRKIHRELWTLLVVAATGLIGAATGLVVALKR